LPEDPHLHEVERMLCVAECGLIGERPPFEYLLPNTFGNGKNPVHEVGGPYAVMGPGGAKIIRRWQIEKFLELGCRLSTLGLDIVFVGDSGERDMLSGKESLLPPRTVNLIGKTDIEELASIMRGAKVVVANDSGPMHLANALATPVVGIFGSGDVVRTRPYLDEKSRVVTSPPMDCKPCYVQTCITPTCMDDITVEEAWKAVRELLGRCKEQDAQKHQA
jgi:ADP-heptose:LPS heptosyltransferase